MENKKFYYTFNGKRAKLKVRQEGKWLEFVPVDTACGYDSDCGNCGVRILSNHSNYCPNCGIKIINST